LRYTATLVLGLVFGPGLIFPVRVGFTAFSGIAQVFPNLIAPSIFPALQSICLADTFHFSVKSSARAYPIMVSTSLGSVCK